MKCLHALTVLIFISIASAYPQIADSSSLDESQQSVLQDTKLMPDTDILPDTAALSDTTAANISDTLAQTDNSYIFTQDPEWDTSYFSPDNPEYNLILATDREQYKVVKMLLERGAYVNTSTDEGVTPLMYAAESGNIAITEILIARGAYLNERPSNGISALIGAVRSDHYEVAKMLLDSGALVNQKDYSDLSALTHASAYNYSRMITLLSQHGANLESEDWFGTTPLMTAVYYNCYEAARELIRLDADINAQDTFGFTPLMIAAQHGDYDMAWMLLDKGADTDIQNKGGQHAISIAVLNEHPDIVELLIENGAHLNQNISSSTNALNIAEEQGKDEMITYLKELGARKNNIPEISGLRFGSSIGFNGDVINVSVIGGVSELKYNSFATTGFVFRPTAVRILRSENSTLSYQYWERRYSWPITIGKQLSIVSSEDLEIGFRIQLTGALTWGGYRGSDRHPKVNYLFVPSAGIYRREKFYGVTFDYEYVPLKVHDISPHRIRVGMEFYIDIRKRTKFTYKHIDWF
jgi:uncharacterized protein